MNIESFFKKTLLFAIFASTVFFVGNKNIAAAASNDNCSSKYGADFMCIHSLAIIESRVSECKSDASICPTGNKCCPVDALSINNDKANSGPPCSTGYFCKNTVGAPASSLNGCFSDPCKTGDIVNGRCCPLAPPSDSNINVPQVTDTRIPGTSVDANSGLIKCGRPGQNMCTLCDLIAGMNVIIKYLMQIAIGVALLAITIGGAMYIISAGDKNMIGKAKTTMENAAWGFVIIFAGYLIINTTITYLGAKTDANGNATFGMNITSWGQFDCTPKNR